MSQSLTGSENSMHMALSPNMLITVTKKSDTEWMAIGSRKILHLEIERNNSFDRLSMYSSIPLPTDLELSSRLDALTMVISSSPLSAIGALIDSFREEEKQELLEEEDRKKNAADLERFGGKIDEELIRKITKWRKKQEKKKAKQRELRGQNYDAWADPYDSEWVDPYDPDREWDF